MSADLLSNSAAVAVTAKCVQADLHQQPKKLGKKSQLGKGCAGRFPGDLSLIVVVVAAVFFG